MTPLIFPLAVSALALAAAAAGLLMLWHVSALWRRTGRRAPSAPPQWEVAVQALQQGLSALAARMEEYERHPAAAPVSSPPKAGLNLGKRSQALRMYRRGDSPERIAAALEIPRQEVELLLKVHRIVLSSF